MGHLKVKVVPGSSRNQIVGWLGDALKIKVAAPAWLPWAFASEYPEDLAVPVNSDTHLRGLAHYRVCDL